MYWVIINTTTLGNAALYPTTTLGRVCSVFVAYIGILALALPISIVYVTTRREVYVEEGSTVLV